MRLLLLKIKTDFHVLLPRMEDEGQFLISLMDPFRNPLHASDRERAQIISVIFVLPCPFNEFNYP